MRLTSWLGSMLAAAWLVAVGFGWLALFEYANLPGDPGTPPEQWPAGTLETTPDQATMVMAIHPHCSCSRASLGELARLQALVDGRARTYVVFLLPSGVDAEAWTTTDLWSQAAQIPGVEVVPDPEGRLLERFAVATSGHVVLYGPAGDRWFTGGITPSRSHMGDSAGRERILARLLAGDTAPETAAVYGCGLADRPLPNQLAALAQLAVRRLGLVGGA